MRIKKRQYLISVEDLELILHPTAEEGKKASVMGDIPVAVLSSHSVSHYFDKILVKLLIPIDSLRENKVMSLKTKLKSGKYFSFDIRRRIS